MILDSIPNIFVYQRRNRIEIMTNERCDQNYILIAQE